MKVRVGDVDKLDNCELILIDGRFRKAYASDGIAWMILDHSAPSHAWHPEWDINESLGKYVWDNFDHEVLT